MPRIGDQDNPKSVPKVLDLSHELLSFGAVAALSDLLAIDWGCKKLVLDGCGLDDEVRLHTRGSFPTRTALV